MTEPRFSQQPQRGLGDDACAAWTLAPGRAASLVPPQDAALRVRQGQVWITFDGPHSGHGNESGDHFLQPGEELCVRAGQRVVLEPFGRSGATPVRLEWVAPAAPCKGRASKPAKSDNGRLEVAYAFWQMLGVRTLLRRAAGRLRRGRQHAAA